MKQRIKPRNPLVAPALFRKAGQHRKPIKATRRDEKVQLQKACEAHGLKPCRSGTDLASFREGCQASDPVLRDAMRAIRNIMPCGSEGMRMFP